MTSFPRDPPTPPPPPSKEEAEHAASDAGDAAKEAVDGVVEAAQNPPPPPDPPPIDIEGTDPFGGEHHVHADRDFAGTSHTSYEGTDPSGTTSIKLSKDTDASTGNEEKSVELESPHLGFGTTKVTPGDGEAADDSLHPDSHLRIDIPSPDGGEDLLDFNTRTEGSVDSDGSGNVSMSPGDSIVTETHLDTPFTDLVENEFRVDAIEGDAGTDGDTGLGGPDTPARYLDADETLAEVEDPGDFDLA